MSHTRSVLLACVLAALPVPAVALESDRPSAERYNVRLEYLWWSPQPTGELQKGFSETTGTLIDAQTDLGLQAYHSPNQLRGVLRLGNSWKLRGSWSRIDFRGDLAAPRQFTYGNTTLLTGQHAISSLKGNYATAELEWDAVQRAQGYAGLLFGAKLFDIDTLLLNVDASERVAETNRLPVPVLGVTGRVYVHPRLSVGGEFSGLTIGNRGHVWEWMVAGRLHVSDHLAGTVGYRKLSLVGRDDRDSLQLDLGKWTFGVELSL